MVTSPNENQCDASAAIDNYAVGVGERVWRLAVAEAEVYFWVLFILG